MVSRDETCKNNSRERKQWRTLSEGSTERDGWARENVWKIFCMCLCSLVLYVIWQIYIHCTVTTVLIRDHLCPCVCPHPPSMEQKQIRKERKRDKQICSVWIKQTLLPETERERREREIERNKSVQRELKHSNKHCLLTLGMWRFSPFNVRCSVW